jgi:hypothetical protein
MPIIHGYDPTRKNITFGNPIGFCSMIFLVAILEIGGITSYF